MIIFSSLSAKRELKKQEEEAKAEDKIKVNPYKVAKETGKSVETIVAKTEKEKEKAKAHAEKKNKGKTEANSKVVSSDADAAKDTKRVTGPRPISVTGQFLYHRKKSKKLRRKEKRLRQKRQREQPDRRVPRAKAKIKKQIRINSIDIQKQRANYSIRPFLI